jgi:DNA-binding CsgD family transcriptional regulator/pimeloyl-ACP methyl ester carboxylesterase
MNMPPIHYAHARDGTRIAWTKIPGKSPPWLHVFSLGAPTIEMDFSIRARIEYIKNLARDRATILFDHRGSGFSGSLHGGLVLEDLVDDIVAVTTAVGEEVDVSVLGTGCFAAFGYAARGHPGWRSLVLQNPVVRFRGSYQDVNQSLWRAGRYTDYLRGAGRSGMDMQAEDTEWVVRRWAEVVPEATAAAYRLAVLDREFEPQLAAIKLPTLVLSGGDPMASAAIAAGGIPGALLAQVPVSNVTRPARGSIVRDAWESNLEPLLRGRLAGTARAGTLSRREIEVLRLLAHGRTNLQIGDELTVTQSTVAAHVRHILDKTRSANRAEAAAWAVRHRID